MKVKELIEELKKYEPEMEVKYCDCSPRGEIITEVIVWCPGELDDYEEFVLIS